MANETRDRLVRLIDGFVFGTQIIVNNIEWDSTKVKELADHLIENGVVVPPCKVGETVYYIHETYWDKNYKDYIETKELKEDVVQIVECPQLGTNFMLEAKEFDWDLFDSWLNGKIFLTKSEAEQKLKEMRGAEND